MEGFPKESHPVITLPQFDENISMNATREWAKVMLKDYPFPENTAIVYMVRFIDKDVLYEKFMNPQPEFTKAVRFTFFLMVCEAHVTVYTTFMACFSTTQRALSMPLTSDCSALEGPACANPYDFIGPDQLFEFYESQKPSIMRWKDLKQLLGRDLAIDELNKFTDETP